MLLVPGYCSKLLAALLLLLFLPAPCPGANILVISPSLSPSLLIAMGRLADTLAETGRHNVTVWIPEMRPLGAMTGTRLAHRVFRTDNISDAFDQVMSQEPFDERAHSFRTRIAQDDSVVQWCEALLARESEWAGPLRAARFDLVMYDLVELCLVGVAHHLDIPRHIWVSTGPMPEPFYWFFGIPQPLSVVPTLQSGSMIGPRMSRWERLVNVWEYVLALVAQWRLFRGENAAFWKHIAPDFPALEHLAATQIDLAFVYGDEFVDPALPTLAKVINIGGLGIRWPPNALKPDLLRAVESGSRGAVLLSFGSNTDTAAFDRHKLANLYRAFSDFPDFSFIVKAGKGDTFSRNWTKHEGNIHLFEWVEQTDLLAHPALRLFISHAGANSVLESAIRGVPLLTIPLFFDQLRVAKCAEYRGMARILSKQDLLDVGRIKQELGEMLENPKYKANAARLYKLHRQKPDRPEERVIAWTEFLLANGPLPELIPESARIGIVAYFGLDLALIAFVAAGTALWTGASLAGWVCRKWRNRNLTEAEAARPRRPMKRLLKRD